MPNIYLEKIALTIEDTRAARMAGTSAENKHRLKGAATGAAIVGTAGAGVGYHFGKKMINDPIYGHGLRSTGLGKGKLRAAVAGAGAVFGAAMGAISGDESNYKGARKRNVSEQRRILNQALTKSAALSHAQVEMRVDRNDAIRDLSRVGGAIAGTASAASVVGGVGIHKGMKENGGYAAAKDYLKNSYARRKLNPEKKIGKGAYLTKLEDIKPSRSVAKHIDRSDIARKVGNSFGSAFSKKGIAAVIATGLVGGYAAGKKARNSTDRSDVNYYSKLSKKNG